MTTVAQRYAGLGQDSLVGPLFEPPDFYAFYNPLRQPRPPLGGGGGPTIETAADLLDRYYERSYYGGIRPPVTPSYSAQTLVGVSPPSSSQTTTVGAPTITPVVVAGPSLEGMSTLTKVALGVAGFFLLRELF